MTKTIYLDNAATTKLDPEVLKAMQPYFTEKYGNPSSNHKKGNEAKIALEQARTTIAKAINAKPTEIIFTSGGTEANNLALQGILDQGKKQGKNHIITSKIEHDSILNTCKELNKNEITITYLKVDKEGFIDLNELKKAITNKTALVSIIHANNEIGTIQDLGKIGKICKEKEVYFHTDACQSFTKTEIDVEKQHIDCMTLNAHKIHGPKGIGALFLKTGIKITPLLKGGGQEFKRRSGTENIPAIVGFAKAVQQNKKEDIKKMTELRDKFIKNLLKIPNTTLNGPYEKRLCNNINISFNKEAETLEAFLDAEGIYTSTSSACSSKSLAPSHVLLSIGLTPKQARSSLRLSISKYTTEQELDETLKIIKKIN